MTLKEARQMKAAAGWKDGETPRALPKSFVNRTRQIREGSIGKLEDLAGYEPDPAARQRSKAYITLTHAMWHCAWGSGPEDRTPDAGDLAAEALLLRCRKALVQ